MLRAKQDSSGLNVGFTSDVVGWLTEYSPCQAVSEQASFTVVCTYSHKTQPFTDLYDPSQTAHRHLLFPTSPTENKPPAKHQNTQGRMPKMLTGSAKNEKRRKKAAAPVECCTVNAGMPKDKKQRYVPFEGKNGV